MTTILGYLISWVGIFFAIWSPAFLTQGFIYLSAGLALLGLLLCFCTSIATKRLVEPSAAHRELLVARLKSLTPHPEKTQTYNTIKDILDKCKSRVQRYLPLNIIMMWVGQLSLLLVSIVFFNFMEEQTRISTRLHSLPNGEFFQMLKSNVFTIGLLPWVIYAVVGVGFCYFCVVQQKRPYLPEVTLPLAKRQPWLFLHNFLGLIVEINTIFPILFVTGLAMIYLCETGNSILGNRSLSETPFLTIMLLGMFIVTFRRLSAECIIWMTKNQISLGNILILLLLAFAISMLWLHTLSMTFIAQLQPLLMKVEKSHWVGNLSEDVLQRRLPLFIWGWWMVWAPWMVTFVARWSIGLSIRQALISALILPVGLFLWFVPTITIEEWIRFSKALEIPLVRVWLSLGLLAFIWLLWGKMRNTMDVSLGCMLPLKRWKQRSLKAWMNSFSLSIITYVSAWLAIGWIPAQVIATYGGGFINVLVLFFLGRFLLEIFKDKIASMKEEVSQNIQES
jgi:hypothetical protein